MLAEWIAPLTVTDFERAHLHRSAWTRPRSASRWVGVLDWQIVGDVLAAEPPPQMCCANGEPLPFAEPRDLGELSAYLRMGIGIALSHAEHSHRRLAAIARSFTRHFGGAVDVQLIVTPAQTRIECSRDATEHLFVAQTVGITDYWLLAKSGAAREADEQFATLVAGDVLYVPPRWSYMALYREDSISISVGVTV